MAYTDIDDPTIYFNTKLYTGNGSTQSITGVGFQPDWVWIKNRTAAENHFIFDSVRGALNVLKSNSNGAAGDTADSLTAFTSDGFNLGNLADTNRSGNSVASWNWKAGTSVSGTTTGSGTSKAYSGSVSTDAGFSIIGYVGNGTAGHTIPHHLGAVPKVIIIKQRDNDGAWNMYNVNYGNGKAVELNTTSALFNTDIFNNTTPTNSVFSVKTSGHVNTNNSNYIAYCFAEKQGYSKFGSYTGNGNADGTFVYTGFSPSFVMVKKTNGTGNWVMFDNKRNTFNVVDKRLVANLSDDEGISDRLDFLSNGWKFRSTATNVNGSDSYIYMCFASEPFTTSTGIPCTAR